MILHNSTQPSSNFIINQILLFQYDIQPLVRVCIQSMLNSITVESAAKLYYTADLYRLKELKLEAINFICKNPREVAKTTGWKEFIKSKPDLMEELYLNLADKY